MRVRNLLAAAVVALPLAGAAPAGAATFRDVPATFWARGAVSWAADAGWVEPRGPRFEPRRAASWANAARVLASANRRLTGEPVAADPFAQARREGWFPARAARLEPITQLDLDRAAARMLGLRPAARAYDRLRTADGWRPWLPQGFGVEQVVRKAGLRLNVSAEAESWELWPRDRVRRAHLAVQAQLIAGVSSWSLDRARAGAAVARELPAWTPLQRAVLATALRQGGAPYVWGGEAPTAAGGYGPQAVGGFDCSGLVWWVMRMHTYRVQGHEWTGAGVIGARTTYDMAAALPVARRIPYASLRVGDVVFWSTDPHGVRTASATVYHAGIYLGGGWVVNSIGSGAGVTLDSIEPGAGWFHDAFAFGWRVLPAGR
jgi:NlpC/P60 family